MCAVVTARTAPLSMPRCSSGAAPASIGTPTTAGISRPSRTSFSPPISGSDASRTSRTRAASTPGAVERRRISSRSDAPSSNRLSGTRRMPFDSRMACARWWVITSRNGPPAMRPSCSTVDVANPSTAASNAPGAGDRPAGRRHVERPATLQIEQPAFRFVHTSPDIVACGSDCRPTNPARDVHRSTARNPWPGKSPTAAAGIRAGPRRTLPRPARSLLELPHRRTHRLEPAACRVSRRDDNWKARACAPSSQSRSLVASRRLRRVADIGGADRRGMRPAGAAPAPAAAGRPRDRADRPESRRPHRDGRRGTRTT